MVTSTSPFANHRILINQASDPIDMDAYDEVEDTDVYQSDMLRELFNAVISGDEKCIDELVNEGHFDVSCQDIQEGTSALHLSCLHDKLAITRILLDAGAEAMMPDRNRVTPFHLAASHSTDCLKYMIEKLQQQADGEGDVAHSISIPDSNQRSPLHWAAAADEHDGWRYYNSSFKKNKLLESIKILLAAGANPLAQDGHGRTPISLAAGAGRCDVVQALLDDPSCGPVALSLEDNSGALPLHRAAEGGHSDVLKFLISPLAGVGIDTGGLFVNRTALHVCAALGHDEAAKACLQLGASHSQQDSSGASPLHAAAEYGHMDVLSTLIKAGGELDLSDGDGWLPLHLAANCIQANDAPATGHMACIDALVAAKGKEHVNVTNCKPGPRCGWTALHCATKQGHEAMVRHLVSLGADPTLKDCDGWSPLHHAAADGLPGVLSALSEGPCCTTHTCGTSDGEGPALSTIAAAQLIGHTPISLSIIRHRDSCVDLLIQKADQYKSANPDLAQSEVAEGPVSGAEPVCLSAPSPLTPIDPPLACLESVLDNKAEATTSKLWLPVNTVADSAFNARHLGSDELAGVDWTKASLAATVGREQAQEIGAPPLLPPPNPPTISPAHTPLKPLRVTPSCGHPEPNSVSASPDPPRWIPLGRVSGLVEIEQQNNLLRSSEGNNDVEAWLWHVDGDRQAKGWSYFEVEIVEPGTSGKLWLGWCPGPEPAQGSLSGTLDQSPGGSSSSLSPLPRRTRTSFGGAFSGGGGLGTWLGSGTLASSPLQDSAASVHTPGRQSGSGAHRESFGRPSLPLGRGVSSPGGAGTGAATKTSSLLPFSYAICSRDGHKVQPGAHSSAPYLPKLTKGDVIGMMYNRACRTISVTHNRKFVSIAFTHVSDGPGNDADSGREGGMETAWSDVSSWGAHAVLSPHVAGSSYMQSSSSPFGGMASAGRSSLMGISITGPMCPVIGLKSGGAVLRVLMEGDAVFKNLDNLLLKEEMLHNPHRMDPALSTPWRFKKHLHALHFAAASNNLHALTQLISIWPSHVNCRDDDGWTPITMACVQGHLEAVEKLLDARADVDAVTYYGSTPLMLAVRLCNVDIVQALIKAGADLQTVDHNKRTLLMRAAKSGSLPIIELLLKKGCANIHAQDKYGKTLLQFPKDEHVIRYLNEVVLQDSRMPGQYQQGRLLLQRSAPWVIAPGDIEYYSHGGRLGYGSFGEVVRAKWRGSVVAAKVLNCQLEGEDLEAFGEEVNLMFQMRHPHVIQFLGAVTAPGQQSIVSELATRGDLQKVLKEFPKGYQEDIQENKLFRMAIGIARGMNYLHTSNPPIIHRDLSAKNCLVTQNYIAKVADFGLSTIKNKEIMSRPFIATLVYMAPELKLGGYTEMVDVYSFGAILYEMVTRSIPWSHLLKGLPRGSAFGPVLMHHLTQVPTPCLRDHIPPGLDPLVHNLMAACLDPDPNLRPTFAEIVKRLEKMPANTRLSAPEVGIVPIDS